MNAITSIIIHPQAMITHLLCHEDRVKRVFRGVDGDEEPEMIRSLRYARQVRERARLALRFRRLAEAEDAVHLGESEQRYLAARLTAVENAVEEAYDVVAEDVEGWNTPGEYQGMPLSEQDSPWKWQLLKILISKLPDVQAATELGIATLEEVVQDTVAGRDDHLLLHPADIPDLPSPPLFHTPSPGSDQDSEQALPPAPPPSLDTSPAQSADSQSQSAMHGQSTGAPEIVQPEAAALLDLITGSPGTYNPAEMVMFNTGQCTRAELYWAMEEQHRTGEQIENFLPSSWHASLTSDNGRPGQPPGEWAFR